VQSDEELLYQMIKNEVIGVNIKDDKGGTNEKNPNCR